MPKSSQPLSEAQIEHFFREGYVVAEDLVARDKIDQIVEILSRENFKAGGVWDTRVFAHENPAKDARLHQLLVDDGVVDATEQIFEAPARVYYGMVAVVPAHGGKGLAWHQDNMYSAVQGRALNCFIALCDITPEKAILWVAPRTHLKGIFESETMGDGHLRGKEPANGMPLPELKKGSVCIFDRSILHHSKSNTTGEHRYAYAAQYQEEKARNAEGKREPGKMLARELKIAWEGLLD